MIRQSYIFLPRISNRTEQNIWNQGIRDWQDFLLADKIDGISSHKKPYFDRRIKEARKNLYTFNSSYFADLLPTSEHWRLYEFFKDDCCFIDIETSSATERGYVTVVGLFDGIYTKIMVKGINLDYQTLKKELGKYKMLVSFNGLTFDLPYLNRQYPDLIPQIPHLDLRHACQKVGLKGGLKQVEKQLGIERRNKIIERMYGGDAIRLWRMWIASGDEHYLKLLVEYNEEDIVNLKPIADYVYNALKK